MKTFDEGFDTVFKQFKDNTKPMCELMGCPELVEDFIVDVEINRQSFKSFYEAGQQSKQAEIDNLQKRIEDIITSIDWHIEDCELWLSMNKNDSWKGGQLEILKAIKKRLKGDSSAYQSSKLLFVSSTIFLLI